MKNYLEIFNQIKETSSRLEKERLLAKYENIDGFKQILSFVYNPLIKSGLAAKKIKKEVVYEPVTYPIEDIHEAIEYVKLNNTGTDGVIKNIQVFLSKLESDELRDLAIGILTKDLPIGLSRTTLNKVYGSDFIPKHSVMLATKYETGKVKDGEEFVLSLKIDGNRVTVFNYETGPIFVARSGHEIDGLDELAEIFEYLPKGFTYDGEIISANKDLPSDERFRDTQKLVKKKGKKVGLEFILFDMLKIEEFNKGKSTLSYGERLKLMKNTMSNFDLPLVSLVPIYYQGADQEVISEYLKMVEDNGHEGLMMNLVNTKYECKRSKGLFKIKTFYTVDLKVLSVNEEVRGGKCGSVTVDYKGYELNVPILKEADQNLFWKNPQLIIGQIIEVKYFEESQNENREKSLRFPSFIRIRDDKEEVSYD